MKKINLLFMLLLIVALPIFANWNVGTIVDEFGDSTGESFIYCTSTGKFSNSATSSSDCYIRVLPVVEIEPYFRIAQWKFEIHNYDWGNSVIEGSGTPIYKIKDDNGKVYSFGQKFTSATLWNCLYTSEATEFTELLQNNKKLKMVVYIDNTTYNFTIDCSDFNSVFADYKSGIRDKVGYWIETQKTKDDYYWEIQLNKIMGKASYYASSSFSKYEPFTYDGSEYMCFFRLSRNYEVSGELELFISLYSNDTNLKQVSYLKKTISKITFRTNSGSASVSNEGDYTYFCNDTSLDAVRKVLSNSSSAILTFSFDDRTSIDCRLDGKEFEKYMEKAKAVSWL